jgi:HlyD family secretion protein
MSTPSPRPIDDPVPVPTPAPVRPRPRRAVWIGAAALALVLVYRWWTAPADDGIVGYLTAKVDRGTIEQTVTATGTVNPVKTVQVGTYVSGPILALDVDFNSPVKRGQRVAKIDPATFAVKVRQAEANLATARAKVEKSRADRALKQLQFERNKTLLARNLIAQNDVDTAKSDADQADAQLALDQAAVMQSQASLDEAAVNLNYTDIVSPVDGVVVSRNVDVGQTVAASFQTPTLFLIAEDLTKMQVDTNVSESDVGRVRVDQAATFTVDAYPGVPFHGAVAQVRNAPITVQNVVTYDVVIAVDNANQELKPGMTANVTVTTDRRDDVLRVPVRALRFKPEEPGAAKPAAKPAAHPARKGAPDSTVYVLDESGKPAPVKVKVGIRDNQNAEVTGGDLTEGADAVIGVKREPTTVTPPAGPPGFGGGRRF